LSISRDKFSGIFPESRFAQDEFETFIFSAPLSKPRPQKKAHLRVHHRDGLRAIRAIRFLSRVPPTQRCDVATTDGCAAMVPMVHSKHSIIMRGAGKSKGGMQRVSQFLIMHVLSECDPEPDWAISHIPRTPRLSGAIRVMCSNPNTHPLIVNWGSRDSQMTRTPFPRAWRSNGRNAAGNELHATDDEVIGLLRSTKESVTKNEGHPSTNDRSKGALGE
jgi:hypothetical protein